MAKKGPERRFSNVIGFDDAPFVSDWQGNVKVVGTVFARMRLNGVLVGEVKKDGADAAEQIIRLVKQSKFYENAQLIMLQGIALGGFNVIDVFQVHERLALPVLVVSRRQPDMDAIRDALLSRISGGAHKWAIIERLGPMEHAAGVYIQRVGLTLAEAVTTLRHFTVEGNIPEPLRTAHLIAGALVDGQSRGRA